MLGVRWRGLVIGVGDSIVIGGGFFGIAVVLRLVDGGWFVILIEGCLRLGGAVFLFRCGELTIDNGQYVFLRCCDAYWGLVIWLGAED